MKNVFLLIISCLPFLSYGQIGGKYAYEFLGHTQSARSTGLNGGTISIMDEDVSFAYSNPALLNPKMHGQVSVHQNFHFAGISNGYVSYGFGLKDWTLHGGINYIDYGEFSRADIIGNQQETFDAQEVGIVIGAAKQINKRVQVGVNAKYINASYDVYGSSGLAFDIGGIYILPEQQVVFALAARNIGFQLTSFTESSAPFPMDLQLSVSKRMAHLPFRFSVTAHHLQQWNLRYENESPQSDILFIGETSTEASAFSKSVDNFFRHIIFNGEFLIGKNENLKFRIGYNHQRRKELSVSNLRSLSGFSLGFGLKLKKFSLDYGLGYYHIAGAINHISLNINLPSFRKKI